MNPPRVSVVIPAHNAAGTLLATVESVLRQTHSDLEVLVVDDGSSDQTYSLAKSLDDPRVQTIKQDNRGAPAARNTGVRAASGDYIAFLDADDLWVPNKLDRQLGFMRREGARASQTAVWFINNEHVRLYRGHCPPFKDPLLDVLLFRHLPGLMSTLVVERAFLDDVDLLNESLAILEDWELAIRLARRGRFFNLDETLTMYRLHPANRSRDLQLHIAPGFQVLEELFSDPDLPERIRRQRSRVYAAMFMMYAGGASKIGDHRASLKWAARAIRTHPSALNRIAAMPMRRLRRSSISYRGRDA